MTIYEQCREVPKISIHALREEGDQEIQGTKRGAEHFYPRPPRGGRRRCVPKRWTTCGFLSTPSARRATTERPRQRGS